MRLPRSWDDGELLQDEPFLTSFTVRDISAESRARGSRIDWEKHIMEGLTTYGALEAASAWLALAFEWQNQPIAPNTRPSALGVFIEFYWRLYRQDLRAAEQFLLEERRKRGFNNYLLSSTCAERQARGTRTHVFSPSSSVRPRRRHTKCKKQASNGYDAEVSQVEDEPSGHESPPVRPLSQPSDLDSRIFPQQSGSEPQESGVLDHPQTFKHSEVVSPPHTVLQASTEVPVGCKRKAVAERPSSSSASDGNVSLHPSTKSGSAEMQTSALPVPEDVGAADSSPLSGPLFDSDHQVEEIARTNTRVATVVRQQPHRLASNMEKLSHMMARETKYGRPGGSRVIVTDDSLSDGDRETQARPPVRPRPQLATRGRRRKKAHAPRASTAVAEVVTVGGMDEREPPPRGEDRVSEEIPANTVTPAASAALGSTHTLERSSIPPSSDRSVSIAPTGRTRAKRTAAHRKTSKKPKKQASTEAAEPPKKRRRGNNHDSGFCRASAIFPSVPTKRRRTTPPTAAEVNNSSTESALLVTPPDATAVDHAVLFNTTEGVKTLRRSSARLLVPSADPIEMDHTSSNDSVAIVTPASFLREDISYPPDAVQNGTLERDSATSGDLLARRTLRPGKRPRGMLDPANPDQPQNPKNTVSSRREVRKMPTRSVPSDRAAKLTRRTFAGGGVNSVSDVDRIIRDSAAEATEILNVSQSVQPPSTDWEDENEDHMGPSDSSDSDDEPLALKALQKVKAPASENSTATAPLPRLSGRDLEVPPGNGMVTAKLPTVRPTLKEVGVDHPPIWSQSRQEVCESFDWFRSYQGGVYFLKDMVKGYLLSAFSANRDIFEHDGRLIVSHGGGKAEGVHVEHGKTKAHEAGDQLAHDKSVRALLNTHGSRRPVVLLIDDKYTLFPYNLAAEGYSYVVLGFYHITHAWAEPQPASNSRGYVVRYKFAFQWCEQQGVPWWLKQKSLAVVIPPAPMVFGSSTDAEESRTEYRSSNAMASTFTQSSTQQADQRCSTCTTISPAIYRQGWTCLSPACAAFWRTNEGKSLPPRLEYVESFLQLLACNHSKLEDLRPPLPLTNSPGGITTSQAFCKGWHCAACGRLSCRYKWEHWECRNCGRKHGVQGRLREPKEFWTQKPAEDFNTHLIANDSGIIFQQTKLYQTENGSWNSWYEYILPNNHGRIYLIGSRASTNKEADNIFQGYQEKASEGRLAFRRWPLRMHKCRGTLLTNYFSQNSGEPYQYVGGTENTVPWVEAPEPVRAALELIKQRMKQALNMSSSFNEVLSAAYMEKQSMAFHSDSERGLGPVVASLSLGSTAIMHFRPLLHRNGPKPRNALSLFLRHGDVVVMAGADVQNCYEHTVIPRNFRIAATARSIGLDGA